MSVPDQEPETKLTPLEESLKSVILEKAVKADSRLAERVLMSIGRRTPRQLGVEQTLRFMRAVSAVAAVVLVALLLSIGMRDDGTSSSFDVADAPPLILQLEEEELESDADESAIVTALFVDGMSP